MPRLPFDEFAALETVYRETVARGADLGSPGYGRPTSLTTSLVNAGQVELVSGQHFSGDGTGENPVYRARLTPAGRRVIELEHADA